MRRLFAIFLLVLLPLQFSWAAMSGYGEHGSEGQAQHSSHHQSGHVEHADAGLAAASTDTAAPACLDAGCGHCHSTCCGIVAWAGQSPLLVISSHPVTQADARLRTRAQNPPDRPQWARFA
jgi:hypothetical protein